MDAATALTWLRAEIEPLAASLQPALPDAAATPLCEYLRDGRALCLLTSALSTPAKEESAVDESNQQPQDDKAAAVSSLPKNLQRSLHQTTTFHALERVQFFIKWCRATAALDAYVVFSSVQLLDEQNEKVVSACLDALRSKFRPNQPLQLSPQPQEPQQPQQQPQQQQQSQQEPLKSKSSGLWVKRSSHQLLVAASPKSARGSSYSSNQSSNDDKESAPVSSNRLNAFLNKFPSETNVLTAAPAVASATTATSTAGVTELVEDSDDDNNAEEVVETYKDDDDDVDADDETSESQKPREPFSSGFSPRSSIGGSSMSFSFTSDPRHHESFTEEQQQQMNLSFSSVLSSPPVSPKPAPRLRIPSIFERNTEKPSESNSSGASTSADRSSGSSATSSAKSETTAAAVQRPVSKLNIPAAFARNTSSSSVTAASPVAVEAVAAVAEAAATAVVAEAASPAPKPVSKLNIPAAFARSTSTSSSSSERMSFTKSSVHETASASAASGSASPAEALTKKPSRLKIPSAFASGSTPVAVKEAAAPLVIDAVQAAPESGPIDAAVEAASSRSPLAAFVSSPAGSPSTSHSESSSSSSKPAASRLAAFLSTVEVPNTFVAPSAKDTEPNATVEALAKKQESFSDDESDSDESANADDDDDEAIPFDDEPAAAVSSSPRFSVSQETAIGLPSDDLGPQDESAATNEVAAVGDSAEELFDQEVAEQHNIDHHDHTDSEQPFFVVEEVSLTKPATSTKLYAFLSAVDGTESHRLSHTSSNGDDNKGDDLVGLTASRHSGSRHSGSHKSTTSNGNGAGQRNSLEDTTSDEHSGRSASNSVASVTLAGDVILEKERLSGENLALQLKLKTAESRLVAKDAEFASLRAELVVLKTQLAVAQTPSEARLRSAAEGLRAQVAEAQASHLKTIKAAQASRELFVSEKKLLEEQLRATKLQSESAAAALNARLAEAKKVYLKTIKAAQATREHLVSENQRLEVKLTTVALQKQNASVTFEAQLAELKSAHLKTIKTAQATREQLSSSSSSSSSLSDAAQIKTLTLQKENAAVSFKAQIAELKKAHLKTIKAAQASRAQLLSSLSQQSGVDSPVAIAPTITVTPTVTPAVGDARIAELFEKMLQSAKDSEEAARYSAQLAFAARDEAEELIRSQQKTIAELSQRVGQ